MKSKDVAQTYSLDREDFESFIEHFHGQLNIHYKPTFSGLNIDDQQVQYAVECYKQHLVTRAEEEERKKLAELEEKQRQERAAEEKRQALANMLITSGFTFDGYTIVKYSGYISGDDAIQIPRGQVGFFSHATDVGESLMKSLSIIRRNALAELKEAAYDLGCNAVIGVDFDYLTLDPETANSSGGTTYLPYVFGVTANGNAVIIEKK